MRNIGQWIAFAGLFLLFAACEHKELCYHHPHTAKVRMDVDWSEFTKETPTGMSVMIYPFDVEEAPNKVVSQQSNTISHVYVDLHAGNYNSIVYNQSPSEYGTILFRGMEQYETAEVYSNKTVSRWYRSRSDEEKVATNPEWFATDIEENVQVTSDMVSITGEHLLINQSRTQSDFVVASFIPQNIIYTIFVKIHLKGIHNLRSARASLNGLAEGYLFAAQKPTNNIVTQLIENWSLTVDETDPTQGYITAEMTCFGLPSSHRQTADENEMELFLLLVDNKTTVKCPFKVGDKFTQSEEDKKELYLRLELYWDEPLPDVKPEGGSSSGFDAVVEEWGEEEDIDINM